MPDASASFSTRRVRFGPRQARRAAIVAGSVAIHLVLLTPLVFGVTRPAPVVLNDDALIYLQLEPRPLIRGEVPRQPRVAQTADSAPAAGAARPARPDRAVAAATAADAPSNPTPRIAAVAPDDAPPAPDDPWRVTPETMRAAVARSLRTGPAGCRLMDGRLGASEQRLCDDRFNAAAGRAGPLGPRALDAFEARRAAELAADGAREMARYEARRAPPSGGVGVVGASPDCPGGNLRGTCAGAHLRPGFEMTDERLRNNRKME